MSAELDPNEEIPLLTLKVLLNRDEQRRLWDLLDRVGRDLDEKAAEATIHGDEDARNEHTADRVLAEVLKNALAQAQESR